MPGQQLNGKAIAAVSMGILFVWSGVKGWSILGTIGDLVKGQQPAQVNQYDVGYAGNPDTTDWQAPSGNLGYLVQGGPGFASTALEYQGHPYKFGGAPGANGAGAWDCSSMVNYVVGVRYGKPIPGYKAGAYNGSSHGPATGQWAVWPGLQRLSRDQVQANDIIVWAGHMGIAISNAQYMSALNPRATTRVTNIDGMGKALIYGRYAGG